MARCEDYPCCGHESGCCPDFDPETGKQLNMKCTCGATVALGGSSLCSSCLNHDPDDPYGDYDDRSFRDDDDRCMDCDSELLGDEVELCEDCE